MYSKFYDHLMIVVVLYAIWSKFPLHLSVIILRHNVAFFPWKNSWLIHKYKLTDFTDFVSIITRKNVFTKRSILTKYIFTIIKYEAHLKNIFLRIFRNYLFLLLHVWMLFLFKCFKPKSIDSKSVKKKLYSMAKTVQSSH